MYVRMYVCMYVCMYMCVCIFITLSASILMMTPRAFYGCVSHQEGFLQSQKNYLRHVLVRLLRSEQEPRVVQTARREYGGATLNAHVASASTNKQPMHAPTLILRFLFFWCCCCLKDGRSEGIQFELFPQLPASVLSAVRPQC